VGNEFYAAGIAPKDNCSPGENLMLFFGRSLPAMAATKSENWKEDEEEAKSSEHVARLFN